ncbi:MAG: TraB/GumN family protein [Emcibacteraceae bacterium]|nr:TraB/GumN family protein [Emcibacteraceae bacterium]MDG1995676.1 TraB/GumN family protein [Emcibacteraceae bacterium]
MKMAFQALLKINLISIFMVIVLWSPVNAAQELNATPALWSIEKEGAKVFFLGSIHLLPDDVKWYGGIIQETTESADEVVFEVYMTPEKQRTAQAITLANGMLKTGDSLGNYMTYEEFEFIKEQATALGIPPASISSFQPWFASVALSVSAIIREGWNTQSGVDKFIEHIANDKGTPISELETLEAQMATLYDHPLETQAAMLKDTLSQLQDIKKITLEMISAWGSGEEEKMVEVLIVPLQEQKDVYDKLVVQRNNSWIPVIEKLLNKPQTTLVVAGAAHFVGDDGVIKLLTDKGYDVKKVQ